MKVFLIAAMTADGFIARNSQHLPLDWTSKEDKQFFRQKTKEAGVVIMGFNTYKTAGGALPGRLNIIYCTETKLPDAEVTTEEPASLLKNLEAKGYRQAAICGGATIYTMFMEADLIDTMYLTIEPVLFGSGLTLFKKELNISLDLVSVQRLNAGTVLSEYNIIK